jgi:hypothetical protein
MDSQVPERSSIVYLYSPALRNNNLAERGNCLTSFPPQKPIGITNQIPIGQKPVTAISNMPNGLV